MKGLIDLYNTYNKCTCNHCLDRLIFSNMKSQLSEDYGLSPYVFDIEKATKENTNFRTTLWTGDYLQLTLMSIDLGEDIGLEIHYDVDQFIRLEEGRGIVRMGDSKNNLYFERRIEDDFAILIPAGMWHNIINTGNRPLKLYSIYAPPEHMPGTIHRDKSDAMY